MISKKLAEVAVGALVVNVGAGESTESGVRTQERLACSARSPGVGVRTEDSQSFSAQPNPYVIDFIVVWFWFD